MQQLAAYSTWFRDEIAKSGWGPAIEPQFHLDEYHEDIEAFLSIICANCFDAPTLDVYGMHLEKLLTMVQILYKFGVTNLHRMLEAIIM